jgi:hypothetical protein
MNPADIKRQILMESDKSGIRKRIQNQSESGLTNDEIVDMGQAFERMVETNGWAYIEAYLMKHANLVAMLYETDTIRRGKAVACIELMQYVDQVIKAKNDILSKENKDTQ